VASISSNTWSSRSAGQRTTCRDRSEDLAVEPPSAVAFEHGAGRLVDHRADIGRKQGRVADRQLGHRSRQHVDQSIGDIGLCVKEAQRRTPLPSVSKAEISASATTCSGKAEESTIIAFCPPVSAISGMSGPCRWASAWLRVRLAMIRRPAFSLRT
jgi:hypothetical protein